MAFAVSFPTYSQKRALTSEGDTVICFTVPQSRYLLKTIYKARELKTLDSLNQCVIAEKDTVITALELQIKDYKEVRTNDGEIKRILKEENKLLNKRLKSEKLKTKILGIATIVGVIALIVF